MTSIPRPKTLKWRDRESDIKHVPLPRSLADNCPSPAAVLENKDQGDGADEDSKDRTIRELKSKIRELADAQLRTLMCVVDDFGCGSTKPIAVKIRAVAMAIEVGYFEQQHLRDIARRMALPQASLWRFCKCRPCEKIRAGWLGPVPKNETRSTKGGHHETA